MNLKAILKCWFLFAIPLALKAQTLTTGQRIPALEISNILNHHTDRIRLSDFKGKIIILDFWNHYCTACIKSFPKLDSLQKQFKDDIQIILVNKESKDSTKRFFEKRPRIKRPNLIMITGDKQLSELFPAEGYPYCVWIDHIGVIRKFSGSNVISEQSIINFLAGKTQYFIDPTKTRFGSPLNFDRFKYFSYLSQCNDTLNIGNIERAYINDSSYIHMASNCASVVELFKKAYSENGKYNFNTLYGLNLQIDDSVKYLKPHKIELLDTWFAKYGYNYELYLPASKSDQSYNIMQEDLQRYFSLKAAIKEKNIETIVIKVVDSAKIKTKGGVPINSLGGEHYGERESDGHRRLLNQPYSLLSTYLRLWLQYYYPYYDPVQLPFNVDVWIREESVNPLDIESLNEDLKKVGLALVFEKRLCPVLYVQQVQ